MTTATKTFTAHGVTLTRSKALNLIYRYTHTDSKARLEGRRTVLALRPGGTSIVGLDELTDAEIHDRLPNAVLKSLPVFSQEEQKVVAEGIRHVWQMIAMDVEEVDDNDEAIEVCVDANRLSMYDRPDADRLVTAACDLHGFSKTSKVLGKLVSLV